MFKRSILALAPAVIATGCTEPPGAYPSLAPRAVENSLIGDPVVVQPAATPDAALDAKVAALTATLDTNNAAFTTGAAKAEAAAKSPGAQSVGSDSWVSAQAALADIDALRADTLGIQVDLEQLATDRGRNGAPPYPTLDAARARADTQSDAQVARIAAIKAILGEK